MAREKIDEALVRAGWTLQDRPAMNLAAGRGVAVREFKMEAGHGFADYLLFVDEQAVGALEANKEGHTLTGVEPQGSKYADGLLKLLDAPIRPLPFIVLNNGVETRLTNRLDPPPRSRALFAPPRPETLAEWLQAEPLPVWIRGWKLVRKNMVSEVPRAPSMGPGSVPSERHAGAHLSQGAKPHPRSRQAASAHRRAERKGKLALAFS